MATRKSSAPRIPVSRTSKELAGIRLLGLDPGSDNYGYCVLRVKNVAKGVLTCLPVQHGRLLSTIRTLTSASVIDSQQSQYEGELRGLIEKYEITHVIAERYMLRRGTRGTTIETVNIMLGILLGMGLPVKLIPASQWKNAATAAGIELEQVYAELKPIGITPHQIDACHIAAYGASQLLRIVPQQFGLSLEALGTAKCIDLGLTTKVKKPKKKKRAKRSAA